MNLWLLGAALQRATALLGVALGGIIAMISGVMAPIFTEAAKAEREARRLAAALAAGIQALVKIADFRKPLLGNRKAGAS
jgi:hypothetical protein